MLKAIVQTSLHRKGIILALAAAMLGYVIYSLRQAGYDVFPEFAPPVVSIRTEAPGLSPEQVELLVTQPIEFTINGVTGIQSMMSKSLQGLSSVQLVFNPDSNVYLDRQLVSEQLATLDGRLPVGVQAPVISPLTSSTGDVLELGVTSNTISLMQLRTAADWVIKPTLRAVRGVANVAIWGGQVKQYQVQFIPRRLMQYDLSVNQVLAAARQATGLRGSGFINTSNQRIVLQTEGQSLTTGELAHTVLVHHNGINVTLGEVAHVVEAPQPAIGAALVDGKRGVIMRVNEQYGANTLAVSQRIDQALNGLRPALHRQGINLDARLFRPASFIDAALSNLRSSLTVGAILVVIVILLFLFDFRTAAISCTAIPLSLLAAITVMVHMGYTLNTMTLGGLAIAIGEVVDDAVIDVENILRRLRENRHAENPRPVIPVVLDASLEVRSAVVYATFTVALVFVPILMMSGIAGAIFRPLGVIYILSVMASLLVALTVTPALCLLFLGRKTLAKQEPPLVRWLKAGYRRVLLFVERVPALVVAGVVVLTLAGIAVLPTFSSAFLPPFHEGEFIVHMIGLPGSSLADSLRVGRQVSDALMKVTYVETVGQKAGRADLSSTRGPYQSEIDVALKPHLNGRQNAKALADIRTALARFPGFTFAVNTFLKERMEEIISGYSSAVVLNLYGAHLSVLDQKAQQVAQVLRSIPGAQAVRVQSPPGTPQLIVRLLPAQLERWGFQPVSVLDTVETAFGGTDVGQVYQGNEVFNVNVRLDAAERHRPTDVAALPLDSPAGNYVPLGKLADVYERSGRYVILHDGGRRVQTITLDVSGRSPDSFVRQAQQAIETRVKLPADAYFQFTGTAQAQAKSHQELLVHSALAALLIIILLSIVMMNYRNLLLAMANLPFALVGGVLVAFATGTPLSLGALIGFITLFGITLRNSIMMISHYEHLVSMEGTEWGLEAAIRGASERLAPILMTALVTGLGLLPLALGSGDPGREIEGPMAIVILGGLFTSTALNLLVLPTLSLWYGRFEKSTGDAK
jgi:CzcA family heavy metal efflux pump